MTGVQTCALPISSYKVFELDYQLKQSDSEAIVLIDGYTQAAYAPFTPNHSGQRLPPTYYRGCWHVVSRGFLLGYRHYLHLG